MSEATATACAVESLPESWSTGEGIFGGYLTHIVVARATEAAPKGHLPTLASVSFLAAARPGTADLDVSLLRRGRRTSVVSVGLLQEERCLAAIVHLTGGGEVRDLETPITERLVRPGTLRPLPFTRHVEHRDLRVADDLTSASALMRCSAPLSSMYSTVAVLLDTLDPLLVQQGDTDFVPSAQMQLSFSPTLRDLPATDEWLRVTQHLEWTTSGHCVESSTVSSADDKVLGRCRQLRVCRRLSSSPRKEEA